MTAKKQNRDLTPKQKKYIENRVEKGLSKTQSALDAGYGPSVAHNAAAKIENSPTVRDFLEGVVTQDQSFRAKIAQTIVDGLDATQLHYSEGIKVGESPNWFARHSFVKTALELVGESKAPPIMTQQQVNFYW